MAGRFLPDTNILIALFAGDANVRTRFGRAREIFISSIVIGELYYGARKSGRVEANLGRVDELAVGSVILNCDLETAQHYAIVKNNLKLAGHPIPENDIWIASTALQHDLDINRHGY